MTKRKHIRPLFVTFTLALLALALAFGFLSPALSTHAASLGASHATVALKHHYHGIKISPNPLQQNDAGKPTIFLVTGRGLTPNGFYDVNLSEFNDRCGDVVPMFPNEVGDGSDVQADLEGRFSFAVEIIDCVAGTYSVSVVNDNLSGERHEAHVKILAA